MLRTTAGDFVGESKRKYRRAVRRLVFKEKPENFFKTIWYGIVSVYDPLRSRTCVSNLYSRYLTIRSLGLGLMNFYVFELGLSKISSWRGLFETLKMFYPPKGGT